MTPSGSTPAPLPPVHDVGPMDAPVTVAGDVHLSAERPDVRRRFGAFLEQTAAAGGSLVLLGDLFDWWVGRAQARHDAFARSVLDDLARAAGRGLSLFFITGNRDFSFDGADGVPMEVWPDVVRARWGERTVVLAHGDLLCSADRSYLAMRAWFRSRFGQTAFGSFPYGAAAYLARGLRDLSERSFRRAPEARKGIDYLLARAWLSGYGADALVVGHVHTGVHHRAGDGPGGGGEVLVLRDWDRRGGVVRFDGTRTLLLPEDEVAPPAGR